MIKNDDNDSLDKLIRIFDTHIMKYGVATLIDFTIITSTPFILYDMISEISDESTRKALIATGSILFAYEVDRGIRDLQLTKFLLKKREELL